MPRYLSAPNTEVRINDIAVTECYSLEFQGQVNIMPFNAWNKARSEFAEGTRIATGSLILNDIDPQYIKRLLDGETPRNQDNQRVVHKNMISRANDLANLYINNEVVPDAENLIALGRAMKNLRDVSVPTDSLGELKVGDDTFFKTEFNLSVWSVEGPIKRPISRLEGCRFNGNTGLVQGASSQNLKRAYSFLAKDFSH